MQRSKSSLPFWGLLLLTVVLCYQKISLGPDEHKKVQGQAAKWQKILTVDTAETQGVAS